MGLESISFAVLQEAVRRLMVINEFLRLYQLGTCIDDEMLAPRVWITYIESCPKPFCVPLN